MTQLFYNLIGNALKFNDGNPVIDISSKEMTEEDFATHQELKRDKRYTSIRVKDNGIGFDEIYVNKIFSLFQRLNDPSKREGTGLGLSMCKKIVKNHGGAIFANSKKNMGATFTIFLPTGGA